MRFLYYMGFKPVQFLWAVGAAGVGLFAISRLVSNGLGGQATPQPSPLLQRVQALGDLHAVKYSYRDVHEFQTTEEPTAWLASLPGAEGLVHAATRNTALMSFTGTVEAGVDLSKAQIKRTPAATTITLPAPTVYQPNITAQVHDVHRGLVWRDISIATSAIEDAKQRFKQTSMRQGILENAKQNVRIRIAELSRGLTPEPVTIAFLGDNS